MSTRPRVLRISLRALLVLMTILCLWFGKISIAAHRQKNAVEWVKANGGSVQYDWQMEESGRRKPNAQIPGPEWLRNALGDDYFQTVREVKLAGSSIFDISPLSNLSQAVHLELSKNHIRDLTPLRDMSRLRALELYQNDVEDLSAVTRLSALEVIRLGENRIHDISPLQALSNLKYVGINSNPLSDFSTLFNLPQLQTVTVSEGQLAKSELERLRGKGVRVNPTW